MLFEFLQYLTVQVVKTLKHKFKFTLQHSGIQVK